MNEVVVCGAGGFIGGPSRRRSSPAGGTRVRAVDVKPFDEWYQVFAEADNRVARPERPGSLPRGGRRSRHVYNLAADMGGMGFIEANKALCMLSVLINTHLLMAAREHGSSATSSPRPRVCMPPTSRRRPTSAAEGSGRLSGDAGGRLRLGEAVQRAHVPALPRGLRPRDARRSLPQRLRAARHVDGRPREGPAAICRKVIEAKLSGRPSRSRSGATASRRAASCTSTTASTARR